MDVILVVAAVLYVIAIPLALALLYAAVASDWIPVPSGFSRAGWIHVSAETTVHAPPDAVADFIKKTGTGATIVILEGGQLRVEGESLLPGELVGDVVREGDTLVLETQARDPVPLISRIEVLRAGSQAEATVRWHARYKTDGGLARMFIDEFRSKPRARTVMRNQLKLLKLVVQS